MESVVPRTHLAPQALALLLTLTCSQVAQAALFSATLPASRSVQVGQAASFFGTMINASAVTADGCRVELLSPIDADFSYQAADAGNQPVGNPDTPTSIDANGIQSFILTLTPNSVIDPTNVELTFTCDNNGPAPISTGLNTLLFSASDTPTPDMVALAATLTADGVAVIPPNDQLGLFSVASVNVGSTGTLTAEARGTGSVPSPLLVCETNPQSGACLDPPAATVSTTVAANATPTFAVFLGDAAARIPFDPAGNRVFLEFKENGIVKGATSIAARSTTANDVYSSEVSPDIVQARCVNCHVSGGVSGNSRLVFVRSTTPDYQTLNQQAFENFLSVVPNGANTILDRVRGVAHGGGVQLPSNSEDYDNLATYLDLLGAEVNGSGSGSGEFWSGVRLTSAKNTLRRAALILARRLPTTAETAAVEGGDEAALRATVRGLMTGPGFHEFLVEGANDRLHTDAFINGLFLEAGDLNAGFLLPVGADLYYNDVPTNEAEQAAKWRWVSQWYFGLARAPTELIAHVVENDLPYTEILTADYTMVNPIASQIMRSDVSFESEDHRVFKPGQHRGQVVTDDAYSAEFVQGRGTRIDSHGDFIDYPHAGVLNTQAFLNRYPTTETNRNRARSRWTYYHFLGVDIERSAARTTDPEALADTNNPTMNNPACTVCHTVMDPLAGTFQNYGNEGFYRDSYGGLDSLPNTYKHPEWFDENAEPSPYVYGDTWYRDMRVPGIGGADAPDQDASLAWAAQRITEDPRFATAAAKFWWPALMGEAVLIAPEVSSDPDFETQLAAFEAQNADIETLGVQFAAGIDGGAPFNARDLFTEMVMSPWFQAAALTGDAPGDGGVAEDIGIRRLLTPKELQEKSRALLGWRWGERDVDWLPDLTYTELEDKFSIYYGGIDSNGILKRARALTSLMANVAERQAISMACPAVFMDFERPDAERLLFAGIEPASTPTAGEAAIRSKLVELHDRLLGEELSVDDPEIDASFQLLSDTWTARQASGEANVVASWPTETCNWPDGYEPPDTWWYDETGMLNAWTSTLIYLMTDFNYLHE